MTIPPWEAPHQVDFDAGLPRAGPELLQELLRGDVEIAERVALPSPPPAVRSKDLALVAVVAQRLDGHPTPLELLIPGDHDPMAGPSGAVAGAVVAFPAVTVSTNRRPISTMSRRSGSGGGAPASGSQMGSLRRASTLAWSAGGGRRRPTPVTVRVGAAPVSTASCARLESHWPPCRPADQAAAGNQSSPHPVVVDQCRCCAPADIGAVERSLSPCPRRRQESLRRTIGG
jgi:hypothetical protein